MAAITTQEFEHHFKSLYKPLCLFALRYTDQVDDAEDIVQQAFADVWDKNRAGNVIGNLKAYLYQAVRNRSLSFTSQPVNAEATEQLPDVEDTSEEEDILRSERDARLWDAIDQLPPERKKIFLLSKRDGLKPDEQGIESFARDRYPCLYVLFRIIFIERNGGFSYFSVLEIKVTCLFH